MFETSFAQRSTSTPPYWPLNDATFPTQLHPEQPSSPPARRADCRKGAQGMQLGSDNCKERFGGNVLRLGCCPDSGEVASWWLGGVTFYVVVQLYHRAEE